MVILLKVMALYISAYNRMLLLEKYHCDTNSFYFPNVETKLHLGSGMTFSFWIQAERPTSLSPTPKILLSFYDVYYEVWNFLQVSYDSSKDKLQLFYNNVNIGLGFTPANSLIANSFDLKLSSNIWHFVTMSLKTVVDLYQTQFSLDFISNSENILTRYFKLSAMEIYIGSKSKQNPACELKFDIGRFHLYEGAFTVFEDFRNMSLNSPGEFRFLYKPQQNNYFSDLCVNMISSNNLKENLIIIEKKYFNSYKTTDNTALFVDYLYRVYQFPDNLMPNNAFDQSHILTIAYTPMAYGFIHDNGPFTTNNGIFEFDLYIRTNFGTVFTRPVPSFTKKIGANWNFNFMTNSATLQLVVDDSNASTYSKPILPRDSFTRKDYPVINPTHFTMLLQNNILIAEKIVAFYKDHLTAPLESHPIKLPLEYNDMHIIKTIDTNPNRIVYINVFEISIIWGYEVLTDPLSSAKSIYLNSTSNDHVISCINSNEINRFVDNYNEFTVLNICRPYVGTTCPLLNNCLYCTHGTCTFCKPGYTFVSVTERNCQLCPSDTKIYDPVIQYCHQVRNTTISNPYPQYTDYFNDFYINDMVGEIVTVFNIYFQSPSEWNGSVYTTSRNYNLYFNTMSNTDVNFFLFDQNYVYGLNTFDMSASFANFCCDRDRPHDATVLSLGYAVYPSQLTYLHLGGYTVGVGFDCHIFNNFYQAIDEFKGQCVDSCDPNTYEDISTWVCQPCTLNCQTCQLKNCNNCKPGYTLNNGICIFNIDEWRLLPVQIDSPDPTRWLCRLTVENCSVCLSSSPTNCMRCLTPYVLSGNVCILPKCSISNCLFCPLPDTCIACKAGFKLNENILNVCKEALPIIGLELKAIKEKQSAIRANGKSECQRGYYLDSVTNLDEKTCVRCKPSCIECFSFSECIKCDSNHEFDRKIGFCVSMDTIVHKEAALPSNFGCNDCQFCQSYNSIMCPSCDLCKNKCKCTINTAVKFIGSVIKCPNIIFDSEALADQSNNLAYLKIDPDDMSSINIVYKTNQFSYASMRVKNEFVKISTGCINDPQLPYQYYNNFNSILFHPVAKAVRNNIISIRGAVITTVSLFQSLFAQILFQLVQLENFYITLSLYNVQTGDIFNSVNSWNFQDAEKGMERAIFVSTEKYYLYSYEIKNNSAWKFISNADFIIFHISVISLLLMYKVTNKLIEVKAIEEDDDLVINEALPPQKRPLSERTIIFLRDFSRKIMFISIENYSGNFICISAHLLKRPFYINNIFYLVLYSLSLGLIFFSVFYLYYCKYIHFREKRFQKESYFSIFAEAKNVEKESLLTYIDLIEDLFFLITFFSSFIFQKFKAFGIAINIACFVILFIFGIVTRPKFYRWYFALKMGFFISLFGFIILMILSSLDVYVPIAIFDVFYIISHLLRIAETIWFMFYVHQDNKKAPMIEFRTQKSHSIEKMERLEEGGAYFEIQDDFEEPIDRMDELA
jgi:hypothetical protein